jgi:hypothetical protein
MADLLRQFDSRIVDVQLQLSRYTAHRTRSTLGARYVYLLSTTSSMQQTATLTARLAHIRPIPIRWTESLYIYDNAFSGTLPTEVGNLVALTDVRAQHNQLQGTIPDTLWTIATLTALRLDDNQLSGTVSSTIGSLAASLTDLRLGLNQLSGSLPNELWRLDRLGTNDTARTVFSMTGKHAGDKMMARVLYHTSF